MSKKNTIRKGDWVKITNPEFFRRCGYDNCIESNSKIIEESLGADIDNLVEKVKGSRWGNFVEDYEDSRCKKSIIKALAYRLLKNNCKNGSERKLFTFMNNTHKDSICQVIGIKYVKTGKYVAPSSGYGYEGEYEYDPGYLSGEKTHRILVLDIWEPFDNVLTSGSFLKIESCNVEKVNAPIHPVV